MAQANIQVADYTPAAGVDKAYVLKTAKAFNYTNVTKYAKKYIDTNKSANKEIIKRIASGVEGIVYTVRFAIRKKAGQNAEVTYLFIAEDGAEVISSVQSYASYADFETDLAFIDEQLASIFA